jgi:uncharacterized membrane protein
MKKAVWITLIVSLVLVNLIAEAGFYFSGTYINMFFRISLVMGITAIASVFTGAILLIGKLEEEKPLSGHVSDTLGER